MSFLVFGFLVAFVTCYIEPPHEDILMRALDGAGGLYVVDTSTLTNYQCGIGIKDKVDFFQGMNFVDTSYDYSNFLSWHVCEEYLDLASRRAKGMLDDLVAKVEAGGNMDWKAFGTVFHLISDFYAHTTWSESNHHLDIVWGIDILDSTWHTPSVFASQVDEICPAGQPGTVTNLEKWSSTFTNLAFRLQFILEFKAKMVPYIMAGSFDEFFHQYFVPNFCWVPDGKCGHGRDLTLTLPVVGTQHIQCDGIHKDFNGTYKYDVAFDESVERNMNYYESFMENIVGGYDTYTSSIGPKVKVVSQVEEFDKINGIFSDCQEHRVFEYYIQVDDLSVTQNLIDSMYFNIMSLAEQTAQNYKSYRFKFQFIHNSEMMIFTEKNYNMGDLSNWLYSVDIHDIVKYESNCVVPKVHCQNILDMTPVYNYYYDMDFGECFWDDQVFFDAHCTDNKVLEFASSLTWDYNTQKTRVVFFHTNCGDHGRNLPTDIPGFVNTVNDATKVISYSFWEFTESEAHPLCLGAHFSNQEQTDYDANLQEMAQYSYYVKFIDGVMQPGGEAITGQYATETGYPREGAGNSELQILYGKHDYGVTMPKTFYFDVDTFTNGGSIMVSLSNYDQTPYNIKIIGPPGSSYEATYSDVTDSNFQELINIFIAEYYGKWSIELTGGGTYSYSLAVLAFGSALSLMSTNIYESYLVDVWVEYGGDGDLFATPFLDVGSGQGPRWFNFESQIYQKDGFTISFNASNPTAHFSLIDVVDGSEIVQVPITTFTPDPYIDGMGIVSGWAKLSWANSFYVMTRIPDYHLQRCNQVAYIPATFELSFQSFTRNIQKGTVNVFHVSLFNVGDEDEFTLEIVKTDFVPQNMAEDIMVFYEETKVVIPKGGVHFFEVLVRVPEHTATRMAHNEITFHFLAKNTKQHTGGYVAGELMNQMARLQVSLNVENSIYIPGSEYWCDYSLDPFTTHTYDKDNLSSTIHTFRSDNCRYSYNPEIDDVCDVWGVLGVPYYDPITNKSSCLKYYDVDRSFENARKYCKENFHPASDLVIIKSYEKNEFIASDVKPYGKHVWIGLFDTKSGQHNYYWVDGSMAEYVNWRDNIVFNDFGKNEDCVYQIGVGNRNKWDDANCKRSNTMKFVCEVNLDDLPNKYSKDVYKNVVYNKMQYFEYSESCDFINQECPSEYTMCNSLDYKNPAVCSGNGKCLYNSDKYINYCSCNEGYDGDDCQYVKLNYNGYDCMRDNMGYCYIYPIAIGKMKWEDARNWCKDNFHPASDLPIVKDQATQEFIVKIKEDGDEIWLGGFDYYQEGTFLWVDGTEIQGYTPWVKDTGHDDWSYTNGEDCLEQTWSNTWHKNKWNDLSCRRRLKFMCQLDINEAGNAYNSNPMMNVRYKKLQTNEAYHYCNNQTVSCP